MSTGEPPPQPFTGPGKISDEPLASTGATEEEEIEAAKAASRLTSGGSSAECFWSTG